ncbi:N(G),N(G)-dimethylarginine dimethylaminohydrolase [Intrasporangium oryzae NRRL B-24470]|uniref:N(G),N(G)-dimethylarginine dimethylaminohydrolase n=1 Tax=Intrasporangium oryzae NRRL B-24470 TaxID=1386089 RepID=W9GIB2_9MICO|nr:dimethylargininase [Intrasporangium oryzae]EWT03619.1 N(G),N(G)-dimethylarginine dimethylaminohydrolase [Intrasporangium oryzae NRRL B-24470]
MHRRLALVRRPSPRLAQGIVTHIERSDSVDAGLALRQWEEYVAALRRRGWDVVEAPPVDDCPDGVFIEDQVVVHGDVAVLCRSGAPERRAERVGLREVLEPLGYRTVEIEAPGTLDGGDVLKHGPHVWVGLGGRTNAEGIAQLERALEGHRVTVVPVAVSRVLHLKSAVTALPDGSVIGYPPLVDDPEVWERFVGVPEEAGAHVVLLGGRSVLMSAAAPRTAQLLRAKGHDVTVVDISEFEKLEGCVSGLPVRLRG